MLERVYSAHIGDHADALTRAALPSVVVPSRKLTVPVGEPAPGDTAVTVAVKVADWPNTVGVSVASVVVVAVELTVCVSAVDVLARKLPSPP